MNPGPATPLSEYPFLRSGRWLRFRQLARRYGWKAIYKQFRLQESRPWSRSRIEKWAPQGVGLELGVGEWTIAPVERTILSDHAETQHVHGSIARAFFPAEKIPYPDSSFSFVLSEHVLEHLPDAIAVLKEWRRVLETGGVLFLFLPNYERTFDRHRRPTELSHFKRDHERAVGPEEDEHYLEWMENVVNRGLTPHYAHLSKEEMLRSNAIHRHVFTVESTVALLTDLGFEILETEAVVPDRQDSLAVFARK